MAHFNDVNPVSLLFRALIAMTAFVTLSSCAVTYQFDPIEAWVVDAETGKPIEGAVVTANWELVKGSLDGPRYFGQLEVKETVTDKSGRFFFGGFSKEDKSGAELRDSDPQIIVFKAGYEFQRFVNTYRDGGAGLKRTQRTAEVNGKRVQLRPMQTDGRSLDRSHSDLIGRLGFVTQVMPGLRETERCYWQQIPQMILETNRQEQLMRKMGIKNISSLFDDLVYNSDRLTADAKIECVAPRKLFLK